MGRRRHPTDGRTDSPVTPVARRVPYPNVAEIVRPNLTLVLRPWGGDVDFRPLDVSHPFQLSPTLSSRLRCSSRPEQIIAKR